MIKIELGKLLSLASPKTPGAQSLLTRFFATGKPLAKYFCNRHLARDVWADVKAGFDARDAAHKENGCTVNEATGMWQVPAEKAAVVEAEVKELHAKVLEYKECIPVSAADLKDFVATESEMEALADFVTT